MNTNNTAEQNLTRQQQFYQERGRAKYIGKVYDKLTILDYHYYNRHVAKVTCECECGTIKTVFISSLFKGIIYLTPVNEICSEKGGKGYAS
jgi:hypothetical protein